jgi:NADP-dependent 3-hydroxy acid dehydrogenase YdfG
MSTSIAGRVALVTGASSGFGEATAFELAKAGVKVGLSARRVDRLNDLKTRIEAAGGEAFVFEADFSKEAEAIAAVQATESHFGQLDILINNAGVMYLEPVATADLARWRSMFELNLLGLIAATQAALPGMMQRKSGHIVNISSTAGHAANPNLAAYAATKWGVRAFTESLRREVYKDNIRTTIISPGIAATELRDHIGDPAVKTALNQRADSMRQLQSQDIAEAILYAVTRPDHVAINEILMRPTDQEA